MPTSSGSGRRLRGSTLRRCVSAGEALPAATRTLWREATGVKPTLGLASAGKAYADLRQALADLGINEKVAADLGLRLFKIAMGETNASDRDQIAAIKQAGGIKKKAADLLGITFRSIRYRVKKLGIKAK